MNKDRVEQNIKIVYKVYHEHIASRYKCHHLKEDIIQEGILALCRCANQYDETKNASFGTYAYSAVLKSMTCFTVRMLKKEFRTISLYEELDSTQTSEQSSDVLRWEHVLTAENEEDKRMANHLLKSVLKQVNKRTKLIVELTLKGYNQKEIGTMLNVTPSCISRHITKFKNQLKKEINL